MLDQEIPMKWVVVIFSGLTACVLFGWWYMASPSRAENMYAQCLKENGQTKESCGLVVAFYVARDGAKAACASHESNKIQKCQLVLDSKNVPTHTFTGHQADLKIVMHLLYRDGWNEPHPAYYTVRLTRPSIDDPNWQIANSEFSAR